MIRNSKRTSGIPSPVAAMLRSFTNALDDILRSNLVGVYLYGSLSQGAFDPARSDVDCVVVVRRDLSDAQFRKLGAWLTQAAASDPWIHRLQMQILIKGRLLRPDLRGCLYQFGILKRSGSDGNPIIWANVLASGVTVTGPKPKTFLPPITDRMVCDALVREVGYVRSEIADPRSEWRDRPLYRAYAVLTLCRILYSYRKGDVVSKPQAARWALRALPKRWQPLIRRAMASDRGKPTTLPLQRIARFIEFVEQQLESSRHTKGRPRLSGGSPTLPRN